MGCSAESGEVGSRFGFSRVEKSGFADGLNVRENKIKNHSRRMLVLFTEVGKCWEGIGFKAMGEETKDFVSDIFHLESLLTSKGKYGKTARHTDLELLEKVWVEIKI